ncbi:hypothetical protein MRS44_018744 [Fusarium solani]|uniref:uncharacterized protein n=1 Tax=Fusarium solani TaxID=169388 RepID=UPI0032C41FF5|nr:hypothetical protein MRS44_018744 [Fusarium solani]
MNQYATDTAEPVDPSLGNLLNPMPASKDLRNTDEDSEHEACNADLRSIGFRKSITNLYSTSGPRSTVQPFGPGRSIPATLPTTSPFPAINEPMRNSDSKQPPHIRSLCRLSLPSPGPGPCQPLPKFNVSSAEASREHKVLENARLRSMGSQPAIDATRVSPLPTSTAARSNSQPSTASFEAHMHLPPATTLSPRNFDWVQDPPTRSPDMPPCQGMPPPDNTTSHMPAMTDALFGVRKGQLLLKLPGSNDMTSIPVVAAGGSEEQERRKQNAAASQRHREKKKRQQNELSEEVKQLRAEVREMRERVTSMEEEQNSHRDLIMHAQWLIYWAQASDFPSQTSKTTVGMDSLAARPQNYGGGSSPGERPLKRCRTSQVLELPTPVCGGFVNPPTGRRGSELPPKQNLQDIPTRWSMFQGAGISTSSGMVTSVR